MSGAANHPLLIRADAGTRMGTGHVMRCLALAQAWQGVGGSAAFLMAGPPSPLQRVLADAGLATEHLTAEPGTEADARQTIELGRRLRVAWVVIDGYHFPGDYQRQVREAGLRVLAVDDYGHAGQYAADLVLDQNLTADERFYQRRAPHTRLLLGTRYALLRREFLGWCGRERPVPDLARKVLVTLGGGDPDNATRKVIRALRQTGVSGLEAVVVIGRNPHRPLLEDEAREARGAIRLSPPVDDMASLMAWAEVAVTAGGTTSWERAALGLPGLTLVLADNQVAVAAALHDAGVSRNLGRAEVVSESQIAAALADLCGSPDARASMATRGRELVDGLGAGRVLTWLAPGQVDLRPVREDDCRLVWQWANEPAVRTASFCPEPIPWEEHRRWFARQREDPDGLFFIAVGPGGVPVGQVRFDVRKRSARISISLAPECRGRDYGPAVIRQACRQVLDSGRADVVEALVRSDNPPSRSAFLKAGFVEAGPTVVRAVPAVRLVLQA
jgi:UDP-2,4-diacetamido-2,4,6-trideoxy-beta-L-altropyranose hydrolase